MSKFPLVGAEVIREAFDLHHSQYGERWPEGYHVELANSAATALSQSSLESFQEVYDHLKGHWQVFRGAKAHWSPRKVLSVLGRLKQDKELSRFGEIGLTELRDTDVADLWTLLKTMRGIKTLKRGGDSVVAVSKFLHFFNPRLFVILDDGIMWKYVLDRWWLWETCEPFIETAKELVPQARKSGGTKCDLVDYLGVLIWAREILANCPDLMDCFREHLVEVVENRPKGAEEYQALAVEWFLLGLVEIPPVGFVADV